MVKHSSSLCLSWPQLGKATQEGDAATAVWGGTDVTLFVSHIKNICRQWLSSRVQSLTTPYSEFALEVAKWLHKADGKG